MVERGGRQIAALVHDPALDAEPDLVELIAAGASLPIENARLQADLRSQFLFLETVANTAPSLLVVLGTDGRIRNQNRATVEASGLPDEDALRDRFFWDVFIDESEREAMQARFDEAAPGLPALALRERVHERQGRASRDRMGQRARHRRDGPGHEHRRRRHRYHRAKAARGSAADASETSRRR